MTTVWLLLNPAGTHHVLISVLQQQTNKQTTSNKLSPTFTINIQILYLPSTPSITSSLFLLLSEDMVLIRKYGALVVSRGTCKPRFAWKMAINCGLSLRGWLSPAPYWTELKMAIKSWVQCSHSKYITYHCIFISNTENGISLRYKKASCMVSKNIYIQCCEKQRPVGHFQHY